MLTLRTLGAAYLARDAGAPLDGAAAQRRLIALLSVLAVSGEAGLSRDRILGLLWPEGDPERARHALTQSLYHARRTLGADDLFVAAGGDLRLNAREIGSDVGSFQALLAAGDLQAAVELYKGPFLDGFFLSGSSEFEQWVTATRARLSSLAIDALDRLANAAELSRDVSAALRWRKQLLSIDPLSSSATAKLMSSLAASGDRAGALQLARVYSVLVREHLDVDPDPVVLELERRLRREAVVPDDTTALVATHTPISRVVPAPPRDLESIQSQPTASTSRAPMHGHRRLPLAAFGAILVAAGVVLGTLLTRSSEPAVAAATPSRQAVFVAPFRVSGADPSLGYLQEGMVELLSALLADDTLSRTVDPGAALSAWRGARLGDAADVARERVIRIAQRLGAGRVVTGSIVGNSSHLVASASLLVVPAGEVRASVTVEGPADSLTVLVDRLAARLLAANAGEGDRLTEHTTPSVQALRAFLEGQRAFRRGDYAASVPRYEAALQFDSTFALAAMHLALASDRLNDAEQHDRALALAWAHRDELSERDLAHLVAFAGPRYPAPSAESEQLAVWERAVVLAPDRADVWYEFGERFFNYGAMLGVRNAHSRAAAALQRALALDPTDTRARRLLVLVAAREGDRDLLDRVATPQAVRDSMGNLAPFIRWRVALARGDSAELRRVRDYLPRLDDENLRAIGMSSLFDGAGVDDGERALRIRGLRANGAARQLDALLAHHSLALNEGRPTLALDITEQLEERQPGSRAHLRLRVLDALYAEGDTAAARSAATTLARRANGKVEAIPHAQWLQLADLCVVEQWRLAQGLTSGTPAVVARLRRAAPPRTTIPVASTQPICAEILESWWSVSTKQHDAPALVARLDSLMLGGPAVSDASTYANILVARLYERLGDHESALDALRRRAYMTGWPRYLATARREEGRLAALLGDTVGARTVWQRYLSLRVSPEASVAVQVDSVRVRVSVLR